MMKKNGKLNPSKHVVALDRAFVPLQTVFDLSRLSSFTLGSISTSYNVSDSSWFSILTELSWIKSELNSWTSWVLGRAVVPPTVPIFISKHLCFFLFFLVNYLEVQEEQKMNMFEVLFGWRKASRCKKSIKTKFVSIEAIEEQERFDCKTMTAVELSYGNLVNPQIIENLCTKSIPDHLKLDLMKEIARDNGLELDYPENGIEFELQHRQQSDLF
ncbi:hypothetical protein IFM89_027832 [Coptis chinensis]|uniref:Uncharacterized protein n=1 Tax=Coptis chinensis TaxID=261450 RepID=A0A835HHC9_9MAGN|nr:hypothetical protein IFM89_027832 [Coptis chinensis]